MAARSVGFGRIVDETNGLVRGHAAVLGATALGIGLGYTLLDWATLQSGETSGTALLAIFGSLAVSIFLQYFITERLLSDRMQVDQPVRNRRYGSLFGALLLSSLAIIAGFFILVLPALYLAARWLTVTPHLVEGNLTAAEALSQSWKASAPSVPAFVVAIILVVAAMLPGMGVLFLPEAEAGGNTALGITGLSNLFLGFSSVFGWTIAVAAYRQAVPLSEGLPRVFD